MLFSVLLALVVGALLALDRTSPAAAAVRPMLGANVELADLPAPARAALLDRLSAAGVQSVRMTLDWNQVEPSPGRFAWARHDAAVEAARSRGMEVVLVLGPCATWAVDPAWEVPLEERSRSVPHSVSIWRDYVGAAARRFRGRVSHWQVREQPSARSFRGGRSEYLALLEAAAEEIRAVDPGARVICPEAGSFDVAALDGLLGGEACRWTDVVGLHPPADLCRASLAWSVIAHEILGARTGEQRRPVWTLGDTDGATSAELSQARYLLAWAFGAERCYLAPEAIEEGWTQHLAGLEYVGFASPAAGVHVLGFRGADGLWALTWSGPRGEGPITFGPHPSPLPNEGGGEATRPGAPTRADVLRACGGPDLSPLPMVYFDLGMAERPEFGLSHRALRGLRGGEAVEESRSGRPAMHTHITFLPGEEDADSPWMYFDVDDSWMYFNRGRERVAITIECEGSYLGQAKLGFNIVYDSTTGYRFTPWQWVDPGYQWRRYRLELDDVSFSNRDGWDFRINVKGSKQDLWVFAVTVERLPPPDETLATSDR